jgi:ABC-2 type transport system permease protein
MNRMLTAELIKLRTTRTFLALTGGAVGLSLVVVILTGILQKDFSGDDVRSTFSGDFTPLFILLLGAIGMAGEWRHKTITGTVLSAPQRGKLLAAKAISYAIAGVVMSLAVTVAIMVVGTIIISSRGFDTLGITELLDVLWRNLVLAAYLGAVGVFVGALIRNPAGAIVLLLADLFIVENVLQGLAPDVWKFTPLGGSGQSLQGVQFADEDLLRPGIALLVMIAWTAILYTASLVTFRSRDLT